MKKLKMYQALKVVFASAGVIVSVSACSGEESISTTTDSAIESDVSSSENTESFDYFSSDLSEIESLINEEKGAAIIKGITYKKTNQKERFLSFFI